MSYINNIKTVVQMVTKYTFQRRTCCPDNFRAAGISDIKGIMTVLLYMSMKNYHINLFL